MHGRYVTDILKMCTEKIIFENLQGFDLHNGGYTVSLAANFLFGGVFLLSPGFFGEHLSETLPWPSI